MYFPIMRMRYLSNRLAALSLQPFAIASRPILSPSCTRYVRDRAIN